MGIGRVLFSKNLKMKIRIISTGFECTPAIKAYVEEKIGSLDRYIRRFEKGGEVGMDIEVGRPIRHPKHGDVFRAEARFVLGKKSIHMEESSSDLFVAIDALKDRLKSDLLKIKDRSAAPRARTRARA